MTEQYRQPNINSPLTPRQIVFTAPLTTSGLTADDGHISADASLFAGTLRLPLASEFRGALSIQKIDVTANAVTIIVQPGSGDTVLGAAGALTLAAQYSTTTFVSDGVSGWAVIANIP